MLWFHWRHSGHTTRRRLDPRYLWTTTLLLAHADERGHMIRWLREKKDYLVWWKVETSSVARPNVKPSGNIRGSAVLILVGRADVQTPTGFSFFILTN